MNICGFVYPAGVMYCDTDRHENGDYKQIAFIHTSGKIQFFEKPEKIPGADLLRIERDADTTAANYRAQWERLPIYKRYETIIDFIYSFTTTLYSEYIAINALPRPADHIARTVSKYEFLILNRSNVATADNVKEVLQNQRKKATI